LAVAYRGAINALNPALELYKRNLRFPNPAPVLEAVERFVHELQLVPDWLTELQRRSTLVERMCRSDSEYERARHQALQAHSGSPSGLCRAGIALDQLRNDSTKNPIFLQALIEVRKNIEALLGDQESGLSPAATVAFQAWRDQCRGIQLEGERLEVDGCRYLGHLYASAGPVPSDGDQFARAWLKTDMGGSHLECILLAVESMVAWVGDNVSRESGRGPSPTTMKLEEAASPDEPLSDRSQLVLVAMLEIEALDSDRRKPTEDIAAKALGPGTDANSLKNVMAELKTRELVSSKLGRGGGCWLTDKGRKRAEKLRSR
jgi:hypothetical protein